jgi:hypothetical protein
MTWGLVKESLKDIKAVLCKVPQGDSGGKIYDSVDPKTYPFYVILRIL